MTPTFCAACRNFQPDPPGSHAALLLAGFGLCAEKSISGYQSPSYPKVCALFRAKVRQ